MRLPLSVSLLSGFSICPITLSLVAPLAVLAMISWGKALYYCNQFLERLPVNEWRQALADFCQGSITSRAKTTQI
jgi:hypothetical protein